jgi:hypothetical protein
MLAYIPRIFFCFYENKKIAFVNKTILFFDAIYWLSAFKFLLESFFRKCLEWLVFYIYEILTFCH